MPTPSPIMLAICGAKAGIGITYAMSDSELIPSTRPNSAIPIGNPIAITEPNATSRITTAATMPISSLIPALDSSKAKKRSPPSSICSGDPARCSAASAFRRSRSAGLSSSRIGYWTRMTATRPSGETWRWASSTLGRPATPAWSSSRAAEASRSSPPASRGVTTTCAVMPARSEPASPSIARACAESAPGTSIESSRSRPKPAEAATTSTATASHAPTVAYGRRAARRPRRYRAGDMGRSSRRAAAVNIGRRDTLGSAFRPMRGPHFRPMARPASAGLR